jgi:hypothetical protein
MRKVFFYIAIFLVGCSGGGSGSLPVPHAPEITSLALLPSTAGYMEGDGTSVVTAEVSFRDVGQDLQALRVRMPDGTSIVISESFATEYGTFTETFAMPTDQVGAFPVEIRLVDKAGDSSPGRTAWYSVSDWTRRVHGLPYVLNDVIWDGAVFIAVGDEGAILSSADGLDWIARESGALADLNAIAAYGSVIFAVGENILLQSTDHGETWVAKDEPVTASLSAVAINSSQVVVSGASDSYEPIIMISQDRGDTWQFINLWPDQDVGFLTDIVYRDGLFIAAADTLFFSNQGWALASSDGAVWNTEFRNPESGFRTVVDDGSRFTIAGSEGAVIASIDGLNWTEIQTPTTGIDYLSGAWNGTKLALAGDYTCVPLAMPGCDFSPSQPGLPRGIFSTDGGMTWDLFNIDGEFRSLGMASGNGRFVAVGEFDPGSGEGAIYTAD